MIYVLRHSLPRGLSLNIVAVIQKVAPLLIYQKIFFLGGLGVVLESG